MLLRFAPFPRYLKVMLLLTYDLGYELTVMCRNYVLGWLLLCAFCALYHPLRPRPVVMAIVLSLLALTSVYGMVLAVGLVIFLVSENIRLRRQTPPHPGRRRAAAPAGRAGDRRRRARVLRVERRADGSQPLLARLELLGARALPHAFTESLRRFVDGLAPLRPDRLDFWFRWFDVWQNWPGALPWGASALLAAAIAVLYRSWRLMLFFVASVAMMTVVQQARLVGCPRHWAHYFLALRRGVLAACAACSRSAATCRR